MTYSQPAATASEASPIESLGAENFENTVQPAAGSLLTISQVCASYTTLAGRNEVLRGAELMMGPGEIVAVMGPSGCGKSTLLKIAGGLLAPDSGEVRICGASYGDPESDAAADLRANKVGLLFQRGNLIPFLNVQENVEFALRIRGIAVAARRELTHQALHFVELEHKKRALPAELSGGEMQRVALARAICGAPPVLLCDEPTGSLSRLQGDQIFGLLQRIATEHRRGVLIVTHNDELAARSTRRVDIRDGLVVRHS